LGWTLVGGSGVPLGCQQTGEHDTPARNARPDGARRDRKHLADLGVVESAQVTEHDRGTELEREAGEGGVDVDALRRDLAAAGAIV